VGHLRDRAWGQDPDPRDGAPRLRFDCERRGKQAQGERDNEPNGVAPHHLLLALPVYPPCACHVNEAERRASGAADSRSDVGAEQLSWLSRGFVYFFSSAPPEVAKASDASA